MALEFPVSRAEFSATLKVSSVHWTLNEFYEDSGTARGDLIRREIARPKWSAEISTAPATRSAARSRHALMRRIGASGTFLLTNPEARYPQGDPNGAILGTSDVTIFSVSGRSLRFVGLPIGYVLTWGDFVSVTHGTTIELFEIAGDVVVHASGITPFVEVTPAPRPGVAAGNQAEFALPCARMQFLSYDAGSTDISAAGGATFTAIEATV